MIDTRALDSLSLIDAVMPDIIANRKAELTKQAASNSQNVIKDEHSVQVKVEETTNNSVQQSKKSFFLGSFTENPVFFFMLHFYI